MLKRMFIFVAVIFILTFFSPQNAFASSVSGHKIIIDAGHGGTDYGSIVCPGLPEKTANLDIANRLKTLLETDTAQVYMTRTTDILRSNADRYNFANSTGGEVLVSIHLNGSTNSSINGTQGLYGKIAKDKALSQVLHSTLWDGLKLSTPNFTDFGVTNFASGLLLKTNMPATIQEAVFISNANECDLLKNSGGARQQEIAENLSNGLISWFSEPQPTTTPKPGKHK